MLLTIHGSWGASTDREQPLRSTWYRPESPFMQSMVRAGMTICDDPFEWSGDLAGVAPGDHAAWEAGGQALADYCRAHGPDPPDAIVHSHGLQVLMLAAGHYGASFRHVVDVESPPRTDLLDVYRLAFSSNRIGGLVHCWNRGDMMIEAGLLGEPGSMGALFPLFDERIVNVETEWSHGHTGLLEDIAAWDQGRWELGGGSLRMFLLSESIGPERPPRYDGPHGLGVSGVQAP